MSFYEKPRFWVVAGVTVAALLLLQQFWQWEIERIEVGPQKFLVRIHRWGKDLPAGEILAPDDSYKGIMLDVGQEGRHFLNPVFWGHEVHEMIQVPTGKCLVLTRKFGRPIAKERLARGDVLAQEGEQGILREVLQPGSYRINPYAYAWELVNAVEVGPDQVGVRTLKVGKDPAELPIQDTEPRYVVPDGYRGVQTTPVSNGTYYLNPYVETITPVEVRSHRAELTDIEFPSQDGFILKPHVMVEYQVQRAKAPEVLVRLTDEGQLHQLDGTREEQAQNEILQKVILPHIRGYSRIEGSTFLARDFILQTPGVGQANATNTRERLQQVLLEKVQPRCRQLGIELRAVLLGDLTPPPELASQIRQRDVARVTQEANRSLMGQYKEQQKLKSVETLKQQKRDLVEATTRLKVAQTQSQQRLQVEELKLKQELENATIRLEASRDKAKALLTQGKADAAVITANNEAQVAGLKQAVQGFGSAQNYAQYQVLTRLGPSLREIFASDTGELARLFSSYMTLPTTGKTKPGNPVAEMPLSTTSRTGK